MEGKGTQTVLLVLALGAIGVLAFLVVRKSSSGGGGITDKVTSVWKWASGTTQDVTTKSVQTGQTLVSGTGGIVVTAAGAARRTADELTPDIPGVSWVTDKLGF
jgi:hypothetical protein